MVNSCYHVLFIAKFPNWKLLYPIELFLAVTQYV